MQNLMDMNWNLNRFVDISLILTCVFSNIHGELSICYGYSLFVFFFYFVYYALVVGIFLFLGPLFSW
jgi:hypothetical protein